ncbi:glycosyltransferase family 4 protein [Thermodesulfovibrio hydrogeniphilus]
MKIAIIRKKYTPFGGETYLRELINKLVELGWEVHIFCRKWSGKSEKNIKVHKVFTIPFPSFLREISFSIFSSIAVKKSKNFQIIQSHEKTFFQDIIRAGDGVHKEWLKQRMQRINLLKKLSILLNPFHQWYLLAEYLMYKKHKYKKIIAISELVKKNLIEHYSVNPEDIVVIYNGIDTTKFKKNENYRKEIRQKYNIKESDLVALFVGSGFERKGVKYFIQAIERVPHPICGLIVGKGNPKKYEKFIKNQRIIFCGPQKEIEKYYSASDIFIFPTMYEPFGLVVLEAMACGLPVITTSLAGASEIIEHMKDGFIVEKPEMVNEMAKYIKLLIEDKNMYNQISVNAQKKAYLYDIKNNLQKMLDLYKNKKLNIKIL